MPSEMKQVKKTATRKNAYNVLILLAYLVSTPSYTQQMKTKAPTDCDLVLTNAEVLLHDASATTRGNIGISDGLITFIDSSPSSEKKCSSLIDLNGKLVLPGLIDSHIHFLRDAVFPGYDIRDIETANSLKELAGIISQASSLAPENSFIVAKGGFNHRQFVEKRLPTTEELDVYARNHPVYLQEGFRGLSAMNSQARDIFTANGLSVSAGGTLDPNQYSKAEQIMRSNQTDEDRLRETERLLEKASEWGLTTVVDQGDGPWTYDPTTHYDTILELWRKQNLPIRVRLSLLSYDKGSQGLLEERLRNNFQGFGDDYLKVAGVGEHIISYPGLFSSPPPAELMREKMQNIAAAGWTYTQHSSPLTQNRAHIAHMESVNSVYPLKELHWSLAHVDSIGITELEKLKQMGVGVTLQNHSYLAGRRPNAGPPYKRILESGVEFGGGTDARNVAPMNPWLSIYYMTTGKNSAGKAINIDQRISRLDALRSYTLGSAWLIKEEGEIGSIQVGKKADLIALNKNYFEISDEEVKEINSILTIVNGRVVHKAI